MPPESPSLIHRGDGQRKPQRPRTDFTAPMPLGRVKAIEKAIQLRETNPNLFTWGTIAEVIRIYHGFDRGHAWWREELRGRVQPQPRGNSFTKDAA